MSIVKYGIRIINLPSLLVFTKSYVVEKIMSRPNNPMNALKFHDRKLNSIEIVCMLKKFIDFIKLHSNAHKTVISAASKFQFRSSLTWHVSDTIAKMALSRKIFFAIVLNKSSILSFLHDFGTQIPKFSPSILLK